MLLRVVLGRRKGDKVPQPRRGRSDFASARCGRARTGASQTEASAKNPISCVRLPAAGRAQQTGRQQVTGPSYLPPKLVRRCLLSREVEHWRCMGSQPSPVLPLGR